MRKARPVCMPSRSVSARSPAAARLSPVALLLVLLAMSADADGAKVASVDFEIFGDVQGVCFRMYTEDEGRKLGLSGWVKNTRKNWLSKVGSPTSRIDRAEFTNEKEISKPEIRGFSTRH